MKCENKQLKRKNDDLWAENKRLKTEQMELLDIVKTAATEKTGAFVALAATQQASASTSEASWNFLDAVWQKLAGYEGQV